MDKNRLRGVALLLGMVACGTSAPTVGTILATGASSAIAVNPSAVFWSSVINGEAAVIEVGLDGGTPAAFASGLGAIVSGALGQPGPYVFAMDANNLYWTDLNGGKVVKASLSGGTTTVLATGPAPTGIALDSSNVYWTDQKANTVMMVPISGGAAVTLASQQAPAYVYEPAGVAVSGGTICWVNADQGSAQGSVTALSLDGGTPIALATNQSGLWAIAADANNAYWSVQQSGGTAGAIMEVPLSGGTPTQLATVADVGPALGGSTTSLVLDGPDLYYPVFSAIMKVPVAGGAAVTVVQGATSGSAGQVIEPTALAVDATSVYWVDLGGDVRKAPK